MHAKIKRQVALPSIPNRPSLDPDKLTAKLNSDRFDRYFRPELEKQELIRREIENYERAHHPQQKIAAGKIRGASREGGTLADNRQTKSTPKLDPNRLSAKKKSIRELQVRYSQNERLSHELCPPKEVDLSHDSSEDDLRDALVRDDGHRLAEPTIYVLSKNPQHNLIKPKPAKQLLFSTEAGEELQIREMQQAAPMLGLMPRQPQIFTSPKQQKYVREKLVGQQAINKFYNRYKNIDKLREMEQFRLEFNPITAILTILEHYNIPPKRMELIKLHGEEAMLDLRNCGLGSGVSIKAVAQIIEKVKVFQEIDLSYNNIHSDLCDFIIPHLSRMRRINLAYNKIGRHGIELLGKTILAEENDAQLEELNLEGNGISDSAMGGLFGALGKTNSLVILNLSKNWLGNFAAARLKEYIREDTDLTELYLHWCELGTRATRMIFEGLKQNYSLRVLDVSWNQIGLESIPPLCHFLKTNDTLVHLDVSFCEIDEPDTRRIAKALKPNRTLYGIHFQGNLGYIDHKGYLHPVKKEHKQTPLSIRAGLIQRINSVSIVRDTHAPNYEPQHRSICWICEGWEQRYFKVAKQPNDEHCFMHFDFEGYEGVLMNDMGTHHEILRMCPPREVRYFHSRLSSQGMLTHAATQDNSRFPLAHPLPEFLIDHRKVSGVQLNETNLSPQPQYYTQIFNEDYLTKLHCQPRTDDLRPNPQILSNPPHGKPKRRRRKKRPQPQLVKEIQVKELPSDFDNLFNRKAGEGQDRQGLIKQCVDFDISHSRVSKVLQPTQLVEVRAVLEHHYLLFQKIYYFLANNNPNAQGVYSISENRFEKFVEEQSYESKRVTKAKIRLKLVSCLAQRSDAEVQGFYRPQFFEFLLRVAMQKWCHAIPKKEGQTEHERKKREKYPLSPKQAFERMVKSLKKYEEKADSETWRQTYLCTYEVNTVLKSYAPFLDRIYEKYAGLTQKNLNPRMKKKLLLEEYRILCLTAELRKTREGLKDLEVHYRTAKRLEVEDGISDTGQDYLQFLETFCRLAEGLPLKPIGSESHPIWDQQNALQRVPLFLKIQKLLKQMYIKNYDLRNKKFDQLFQLGLFPQEISVLVEYLRAQAQLTNSESMRRTVSLRNIQLNSLLGEAGTTITLGFLIELLKRKAEEVQRENKMRLEEVGEESESQREEDEI